MPWISGDQRAFLQRKWLLQQQKWLFLQKKWLLLHRKSLFLQKKWLLLYRKWLQKDGVPARSFLCSHALTGIPNGFRPLKRAFGGRKICGPCRFLSPSILPLYFHADQGVALVSLT